MRLWMSLVELYEKFEVGLRLLQVSRSGPLVICPEQILKGVPHEEPCVLLAGKLGPDHLECLNPTNVIVG